MAHDDAEARKPHKEIAARVRELQPHVLLVLSLYGHLRNDLGNAVDALVLDNTGTETEERWKRILSILSVHVRPIKLLAGPAH